MVTDELVVDMKLCAACHRELPLTAFYRQTKSKDGRTSYCIICSRDRAAKWAKENPERVARNSARQRAKHPGYHRKYAAEWQKKNPEKHKLSNQKYRDRLLVAPKPGDDTPKTCFSCGETKVRADFNVFTSAKDGRYPRCRECYGKWRRKMFYGLSEEQFETMWRDQGGRCVICEDFLVPNVKNGCSVDHDHSTGVVRGLLCGHCNLALGHMKDNADACERAAAYLRKHAQCP